MVRGAYRSFHRLRSRLSQTSCSLFVRPISEGVMEEAERMGNESVCSQLDLSGCQREGVTPKQQEQLLIIKETLKSFVCPFTCFTSLHLYLCDFSSYLTSSLLHCPSYAASFLSALFYLKILAVRLRGHGIRQQELFWGV